MVVRLRFRRRKDCRYRRGALGEVAWFLTMIWLDWSSIPLMVSFLGPDLVKVITRDGDKGLVGCLPVVCLIRVRFWWTVLPFRCTRRRSGHR